MCPRSWIACGSDLASKLTEQAQSSVDEMLCAYRRHVFCVWASLLGRFVPELWPGGTSEQALSILWLRFADQPSIFRSDWSQCARARGSLGIPTLHPSSRSRREYGSLGFEFTCG
ncbi:unnamed protein product [Effrenium voratum]|nr:unnamed protein product [Effrenium voratum]